MCQTMRILEGLHREQRPKQVPRLNHQKLKLALTNHKKVTNQHQ
jgi:hypothetical protein